MLYIRLDAALDSDPGHAHKQTQTIMRVLFFLTSPHDRHQIHNINASISCSLPRLPYRIASTCLQENMKEYESVMTLEKFRKAAAGVRK